MSRSMSLTNVKYDIHFSDEDLKRIKFLRLIYNERHLIAWVAGIFIAALVFFVQIPLHGNELVHAVCTYGSIPAGVGVGFWFDGFVAKYADDELFYKWDPLFYQRSGKTQEQLDAEAEVLRLTDEMQFIALPIEQQRLMVNKIYRDRGLPEPNHCRQS